MSLINTMLRDLNARHAAEVGSALPEDVRPLPTASRLTRVGRARLMGGGLLLVATLGGLGWLALSSTELPAVLQVRSPVASSVSVDISREGHGVSGASGGVTSQANPETSTGSVDPVVSAPIQADSSGKMVQASGMMAVVEKENPPARVRSPQAADELPPLPSLASVLPLPPPRDGKMKNKVDTGGQAGDASSFGLKMDGLLSFSPPRTTGGVSTLSAKKAETALSNAVAKGGAHAAISLKERDDRAETAEQSGHVNGNGIEKVERSERGDERFRSGAQAYRQGRLNEAISQIQGALRENPRHIAARQALLGIFLEQRRFDESLALLRAGLDQMPNQIGWAMAMARIQVERGLPGEAWAILEKYQTAGEQNADYLGFAAALLQHLKKPRESVRYYKAALRLKPREGRWWYALGGALEADNQSVEAMDAYRQAQSLGGLTVAMSEVLATKLR